MDWPSEGAVIHIPLIESDATATAVKQTKHDLEAEQVLWQEVKR